MQLTERGVRKKVAAPTSVGIDKRSLAFGVIFDAIRSKPRVTPALKGRPMPAQGIALGTKPSPLEYQP